MAANVHDDAAKKILFAIKCTRNVYRHISHCLNTIDIQSIAVIGSMMPTPRSVAARLRSKTLDGG